MIDVRNFRPVKNVIFAWGFYAFTTTLGVQTFLSSDILFSIETAFWILLANFIIYSVLQRPNLILTNEGIKVVNPFDTWEIGWDRVKELETKFVLKITTSDHSIPVWVATASSRRNAKKIPRSEIRGLGFDGLDSISIGDSPTSDSGVAAHLIRLGIKERNGGSIQPSDHIHREVNVTTNTIICLFFAAGIIFSVTH
jgi:hypothetical protein